jgi:ABC-type nitrate/sulfonate/bicarbonate transport system permease component
MKRTRQLVTSMAHHGVPPIVAAVAVIALWELAVRTFGVAPYLLPPPLKVWHAFGELRSSVGDDIVTTMTEAVLGLVLGAVIGVVIATLLWLWPFARRAILPLLVISQTVPIVVLAPLLVLWFGLGLTPKVLVVMLATFFPVVVATVQGLLAVDREQLDLLRTMRAKTKDIARHVVIPSALPSFFSGLRLAASYAVTQAVVGEWVGATSGLGLLLTRAQRSFRIDRVFVAVAVITLFSVLLYIVIDQLSRLLMPWQRQASNKRKA